MNEAKCIRSSAFALKKTDDAKGTFEGYGAVFGNVDSQGDIIVKGAFQSYLKNHSPNEVKLLWQHDTASPIGVYESIKEDAEGLYVKGRLLVNDVEKAREAYALLKANAISGLSIGYSINWPNGAKMGQDGNRYLSDLSLWEISVVTFPSNPAANIESIKANEIETVRDLEKFLRDAGFSQQKAKAIASDGFKAICKQRDVDAEKLNEIEALKQLTRILKEVSK